MTHQITRQITMTITTPEAVMAYAMEVGPDHDAVGGPTVIPNDWNGYDSVERGSGVLSREPRARLVLDDEELIIYRFDSGVAWSARFAPECPVEIVVAAWTAARS